MPASTLPASPLLRLPDELLAVIADICWNVDPEDVPHDPLASLQAVNKRLYAIATPILKQEITVHWRGIDDHHQAADRTLQRFGEHVKALEIILQSHAREFDAGFQVAAFWLSLCPKVEGVHLVTSASNFDAYSASHRRGGAGQEEEPIGPTGLGVLLPALLSIGSKLRALHITTNWDSAGLAADVSAVLRATPNLRELSLMPCDDYACFAFDGTIPRLGPIPALRTLEIEVGGFLAEEAADGPPALEQLTVVHFNFDGLSRLHRCAASSLRSLKIYRWPLHEIYGLPLLFTALRHLDLAIYNLHRPARLLSAFFHPSTPIRRLTLCSFDAHTSFDLQLFVDRQARKTLAVLEIESPTDPPCEIMNRLVPNFRRLWDEHDEEEDRRLERCIEWARARGIRVDAAWR